MSLDHSTWPYLAIILFGFLPTEIWRLAAVFLSRGMSPTSPILDWVRLVATALLAAVVAKLLASPSGALLAAPIAARYAAIAAGLGAKMLFRRSLIAGVIAGEAVLVASVYVWGPRAPSWIVPRG